MGTCLHSGMSTGAACLLTTPTGRRVQALLPGGMGTMRACMGIMPGRMAAPMQRMAACRIGMARMGMDCMVVRYVQLAVHLAHWLQRAEVQRQLEHQLSSLPLVACACL